jgi:hypothetical protein
MAARDQADTTDRLRRALLGFRAAQSRRLGAHRRLKGLPDAQVQAFRDGQGGRLEAGMRAAAAEVAAAFRRLSAAGLVAAAEDRHLVTEAQRYLTE